VFPTEGLWGWSATLGTVGAVVGIAALIATGPLALGLGAVALTLGAAVLMVDVANKADGFTIGMDLLAVIPGAGVLGKDASILAKGMRTRTADASAMKWSNVPPARDFGAWLGRIRGHILCGRDRFDGRSTKGKPTSG